MSCESASMPCVRTPGIGVAPPYRTNLLVHTATARLIHRYVPDCGDGWNQRRSRHRLDLDGRRRTTSFRSPRCCRTRRDRKIRIHATLRPVHLPQNREHQHKVCGPPLHE